MDDEELVKRMSETTEEFDYQFSDAEYMRAVKYLSRIRDELTKDRDSWFEHCKRLMLAATEGVK